MNSDLTYTLSTPNQGIITITSDSYHPVETAMMQRIYADYLFPVEGMPVNSDSFDALLDEISKLYTIKQHSFSVSSTNQMLFCKEVNDLFIITVRSGSKGLLISDIYSKTIEDAEILFNIFRKYEDVSDSVKIRIIQFSLSMSGQLESSVITKQHSDFKGLSKLYYPFLDTDEMFKQYLISNDNLLLLAGASGTGKTKIIDMLLDFTVKNLSLLEQEENEENEEEVIRVVYVKNPSILAADAFWNKLTSGGYDYIVLDDMDYILTDRNINDSTQADDTRLRFISNFLSYTDGMFNTSTKFIITTNQGVSNIDPAILRRGRCFDVLSFRGLTNLEALAIWQEAGLSIEHFEEDFRDQDNINASDLGAKIEFIANLDNKSTKVKGSYIKEDGISLHKKSMNKVVKI